jgi:hypothetical protein
LKRFDLEDAMADHGAVEYATATGNDLPAHEATYRSFVHLAFVGSCFVICIVLGLVTGGVAGSWAVSFGIFVAASAVFAHGLASGARAPSIVMIVLSLLALALVA